MKWKFLYNLFFLQLIFIAGSSFAGLTVSPVFRSDMVLQRDMPVPVFGTADPGLPVTVQFQGQSVTSIADAAGKWKVNLAAMPAGTVPGSMIVTAGSTSITFTGVQVGEVWVCSGQSNMGFPLKNANNAAAAIADAGNHNIRLFRMIGGSGPSTTLWKISNSSSAGDFSAVGYWMGLELSLWFGNVPVGLIQATHDGTAIKSWQHTSGGTGEDYDAMIRSIQPFAVRGVLWYQGESNGGDAQYASKLTNMIREWRADWGLSGLPFGIVQLAYRSGWNVCRNAQLEVADSEPGCYLVVIRDLPGGALHPPEKKPVGIRAAIGARGMVYGENITWSGPIRNIPESWVSGNKVILNWKHLGGGLFTSDGKAPGEFKVATATGQFKTATAIITGNTVEVTGSSVANPARVQYAYSSVGNLYNRVSILTEGGAVFVDRLKVSEFQINVSPKAGTVKSASFTPEIQYESDALQISVYPNPVINGSFYIGISNAEVKGKIYIQINDMQGRMVYEKIHTTGTLLQVNSNLRKGSYILLVKNDSQVLATEKLLVR